MIMEGICREISTTATADVSIPSFRKSSHALSNRKLLESVEFSPAGRSQTRSVGLLHPKPQFATDSVQASIMIASGVRGNSRFCTEKPRECLSPSSVVDSICREQESNKKGPSQGNVVHLSPSHLSKSRERVQSFLKKTLYSPKDDGNKCSKHTTRSREENAEGHPKQKVSSSLLKSPVKSFDKILQTHSVSSNVRNTEAASNHSFYQHQIGRDNPRKSSSSDDCLASRQALGSKKTVKLTDTFSDDGSTGSTSSALSSGGSADQGVIGISQPSYELADSFFVHPLVTKTPLTRPEKSPVERSNLQANAAPSIDKIVPKKRRIPSLKADTSFSLEVVSEGDDEEENPNNSVGTSSNVVDEEEVVFEEATGNLYLIPTSSPLRPTTSPLESSLFDSPFTTPISCNLFVDETPSKNRNSNGESQKVIALEAQQKIDDMPSLGRFLMSGRRGLNTDDDATKCSASKSSVRSGNAALMYRGVPTQPICSDDPKVNAQELRCHVLGITDARNSIPEKSYGINQTSDSEKTALNRVKIFLLLLEPKTKIFELIQLLYPRQTTTIQDILDMIPHNATEEVLARQHYVGLLRPRKRAFPLTNLALFASSRLQDRSTRPLSKSNQTAGIMQNEVIMAIPMDSDQRVLVKLGKKILSNSHIQDLVGIKADDNECGKVNKKKMKVKSITLPEYRFRSPETLATYEGKPRNQVFVKNNLKSELCTRVDNNLPNLLNLDIFSDIEIPRLTKSIMPVIDRYDKEMQRAIEHAAVANSAGDCDSDLITFSSVSKIGRGYYVDNHSNENLFPQFDTPDSFITSNRSSSIASRDTRTTIAEIEESYTSTADDTSFTGSIESSFNSWSRSFDSSVLTRHSVVENPKRVLRHEVDLDYVTDTDPTGTHRLGVKQLSRRVVRILSFVLVFMTSRYFTDTENGFYCASAVQRRLEIPSESLGISGLLYVVISFGVLLKFQRVTQKKSQRKNKIDSYDSPASRCPFIQVSNEVYEIMLPLI